MVGLICFFMSWCLEIYEVEQSSPAEIERTVPVGRHIGSTLLAETAEESQDFF